LDLGIPSLVAAILYFPRPVSSYFSPSGATVYPDPRNIGVALGILTLANLRFYLYGANVIVRDILGYIEFFKVLQLPVTTGG